LCHFATFWKEAAKVTTFFHLCKGGGTFPLPLPEKKSFFSPCFLSKSCVSYWNLSLNPIGKPLCHKAGNVVGPEVGAVVAAPAAGGVGHIAWGHFGGQPLDGYIWSQTAQEVGHEGYVFLYGEGGRDGGGVFVPQAFQLRASQQLQLV
jgi:hypothetical protein